MRVVRAKLNAMVRKPEGGRVIVKKGVTTADADHPIVASHPHLWETIVPDLAVSRSAAEHDEAQLVDDAYRASGASHTEALRAILDGLSDRGYELVAPEGTDVAEQLVALVFSVIDHPRRDEGTAGVGMRTPDKPDEDPHPVAGDLRRTSSGQLQEWGDGMWHDVDDPDPVAPDPDPVVTPEPAADPETSEGRKTIRAWAKANDLEVASSGPLPKDVVQAYLDQHPAGH